MLQYQTLIGIVSRNQVYQTKAISFCVNHTDEGTFFFTRSDAGVIHGYESQEDLDYKSRYLISLGYTVAPYVDAYPLT